MDIGKYIGKIAKREQLMKNAHYYVNEMELKNFKIIETLFETIKDENNEYISDFVQAIPLFEQFKERFENDIGKRMYLDLKNEIYVK